MTKRRTEQEKLIDELIDTYNVIDRLNLPLSRKPTQKQIQRAFEGIECALIHLGWTPDPKPTLNESIETLINHGAKSWNKYIDGEIKPIEKLA